MPIIFFTTRLLTHQQPFSNKELGLFNYLPLSVNLHKGIYLNGFVAPIIFPVAHGCGTPSMLTRTNSSLYFIDATPSTDNLVWPTAAYALTTPPVDQFRFKVSDN